MTRYFAFGYCSLTRTAILTKCSSPFSLLMKEEIYPISDSSGDTLSSLRRSPRSLLQAFHHQIFIIPVTAGAELPYLRGYPPGNRPQPYAKLPEFHRCSCGSGLH